MMMCETAAAVRDKAKKKDKFTKNQYKNYSSIRDF